MADWPLPFGTMHWLPDPNLSPIGMTDRGGGTYQVIFGYNCADTYTDVVDNFELSKNLEEYVLSDAKYEDGTLTLQERDGKEGANRVAWNGQGFVPRFYDKDYRIVRAEAYDVQFV